ncbi:MAG TPA: hypothetical protein EYQ00_01110 [Dehalococcoidia bacterium]|nr:hypothetical protein [Dehalococcoidia bacterium]
MTTSATNGYVMNQTMLRIRDPKVSLPFYQDTLGMTLLGKFDFADMNFSLYFMGYLDDADVIPEDTGERSEWIFGRPALIELTHNWGTESDPEFIGYHDGNQQPQGFGHICMWSRVAQRASAGWSRSTVTSSPTTKMTGNVE